MPASLFSVDWKGTYPALPEQRTALEMSVQDTIDIQKAHLHAGGDEPIAEALPVSLTRDARMITDGGNCTKNFSKRLKLLVLGYPSPNPSCLPSLRSLR